MKKIWLPLLLLIAVIVALGWTVVAGAQTEPVQIPVSFQLLANNGNLYANGWVVEWEGTTTIILEDPDNKLDIVGPACCGGCDELTFVPSETTIPDTAPPDDTPQPTDEPEPTATPTSPPEPTNPPTNTPVPEPTEEPKQSCNRGIGNGGEDCDPGNSSGQGQGGGRQAGEDKNE